MSSDKTSIRVPFRTHQKVRDWAIENNFSVPDAWAHLAELGLEHLELIAESERIPSTGPDPCAGCARDRGHESWCEVGLQAALDGYDP